MLPLDNPDTVTSAKPQLITAKASSPSLLPDAATVLRLLRRRWVATIILGIIVACASGLATYSLIPLKYTARVRFHISTRAPSIVFQNESGDFANFQRTQVELVKSQLVLKVALQRPEVAALAMIHQQPEPEEWLEQQLQCDFPAPEIMRLTLVGKNPFEIEVLLNAITEAYLQEVVNKEKNERTASLERITGVRKDWENKLKDKREVFAQRARQAGSADAQTLAFSHRMALDLLNTAKMDLLQFKSELRRAEVELQIRQKRAERNVEAPSARDADIDEQLHEDKEFTDLLKQKEELAKTIKKAQATGVLGDDHPTIQRYRLDLQAADEAIAARRQKLRPSIARRLHNGNRPAGPTSVSQLADQVVVLRELEKQLTAEIQRLTKETEQIKDSSIELDALRDDITQIDKIAKTVAQRAEAINVELEAPSRVTLLEKPTASHTTNQKSRVTTAGGAALAGFVLAALGILGWELRARRVLDPEEVSQSLKIRLIGTLPVLSNRGQTKLSQAASAVEEYPRDLLTESVDRTCMKLLHAAKQQPLRVLMVTSALSGEGKTSLASHLAISLARSGRRTLLLDADLRRPVLHRLFDLSLEPGLSAVLRGESTPSEVIRPTLFRGLEVIPAGSGDLQAIQALGSPCVGTILRCLQEGYEFVIVDSAPVLAVVDAPLVAQHVDAVLFSILCGASHMPSVYQSYQEMASLGVRILGAVVSGVRDLEGGYCYYSRQPPAE
jgi:capsular exopolysaccharide synthesis family protein